MKKLAVFGIIIALALATSIASVGCSCGKSSKPKHTPTPTPIVTPAPTPTPTVTVSPEEEYDTTRDTLQNTVIVYAENHGGSYPPTVGNITINQEVRYIFDICSLLESNGGTLTAIPSCLASVDGDNNDNFDLGGCGFDLEGLYIWAIDSEGNIYSACIGGGCLAQYYDGYQGTCPTVTPTPTPQPSGSTPTPTPTPSSSTCTIETARALIAQTTDIESMKCDIVMSDGNQTATGTIWQKGELLRMEASGAGLPEGQVWLYNGSSHCGGTYYYYPAENRAEIADSSTSPAGYTAPLWMIGWLSSPDAQLENCSFSCETYNGTECLAIQFPLDFDNVKLWLDMSSGLVIHLQMEDEEAGLITYDYKNIDLSDIPDSMFQLPEGTTITGEDSFCSMVYDTVTDEIQNGATEYASRNVGALPVLTGTYTNAECSACSIVNMSALLVENGGIFNGCPDGMWQGAGSSDDNCDASGGSISGCSASNHYIWIIDPVGNVYSYCQGAECTSTNSGYQGVWP